jgi:hypothetical protein
MVDTLKGAALILAFLGVTAICATWIHIWDATWQAQSCNRNKKPGRGGRKPGFSQRRDQCCLRQPVK